MEAVNPNQAEVPQRPPTIEAIVEQVVAQTITQLLQPYLVRLQRPEPLVFTVAQAAEVLQLSSDSVTRLVKRGVLARVPHIDGKLLIPRSSVADLVSGAATNDSADDTTVRHLPERLSDMRSAPSRESRGRSRRSPA